MKKKLLSIIVTIFMLCTAAASVFAESSMSIGNIVVRLAEYEQEDRSVVMSVSRSLLGLDSGIKMLKSEIKSYNGDQSDTKNRIIGRLLQTYTKEQLNEFLDKLLLIDEDTRYDFFTDIINRNRNPVTDEQADAINDLCSFYLGTAYPDFQRICLEDGVDAGVIAKLLSVGQKINGDNPIYVDGADKNTLAYNDLSDQLLTLSSINQSVDLDETLLKINSSPRVVKAIMTSGEATGLYQGQGFIEDENNTNTDDNGNTGNSDNNGGSENSGNSDNNGGTNDNTNTGNTDNPGGTGNQDNNQSSDNVPDDSDNSGSGNTGSSGGSGRTGGSGSGGSGSAGGTGNTGKTGNTESTDVTESGAFSDAANHWSKEYVTAMAEKGIFKGYEDNTFRPDNALTRQEMAVTVVRVLGIEGELGTVEKPSFTDDDKIADWAKDYVYLLVSRGIFAGYADGSFGPDALITREQFALVMSRISTKLIADDYELGFADNNKISSWAKEAVRGMAYLGIITGYEDNTFRPANSLTRAEACTMIYRYLNK